MVELLLGGAVLYLLVQVSQLRGRAKALEEKVHWLTGVLNKQFGVQGAVPGAPAAPHGPAPAMPAAPAPVAVAAPAPAPAPATPPAPVAAPAMPPAPPPAPPRPPVAAPARLPAPPRPAPTPPPPFDWDGLWRGLAGPISGAGAHADADAASAEARIGTVWLSRIGMLLILVSAIIGYEMLQNSALQALIGWTAGLTLIGLGWWGHRKGYGPWSQAVSGGGVGLLYLVTTAATTVFSPPLLPLPLAFAFMVGITVLGTFLAVHYNAIAVGVLAMVGGFATPYLLSNGDGSYQVLFTYVAILDLGLLGVAWFKRWPLYNYLLFAATWLIYASWRGAAFTPADRFGAVAFASVFFLIFATVSILYNLRHRTISHYQDLGVVLAGGFIYFGSGLELLPDGLWRAFFAFAMAFLHLGLGWLVLRRNPIDRLMQLSFLALSGIFVTIAFPVALHGPWIAIAWALEAASLVWIGFRTDERWARIGGLAVFGLALTRLLIWETYPDWFGMPFPGAVLRGLTFLLPVAALYMATWAYHRYQGDRRVLAALAVAANFLTLWYITFEITLAYDGAHNGRIAGHETLAIAAAWGLYGLLIAVAERRFTAEGVRHGARSVLLAAMSYLVLGALMANAHRALPGYRYFAYVSVLGSIWAAEYAFRRYDADRELNGLLSLAAAAIGFGIGGFEVVRWLEPAFTVVAGSRTSEVALWQDSTRTFWMVAVSGIYALIMMGTGVRLRSRPTRLLAAALGGVAILGVLFGGVANLAAAPWLRAVAFIAVVPGAWLAAWLGLRSLGAEGDAVQTRTLRYLALSATAVTAIWGAAEVMAPLPVATNIYAGVIWGGLYGLAVVGAGLWLGSRDARLLGLATMAVAALPLAVEPELRGMGAWALRAGALAATVGAMYAATWVLHRFRARLRPFEPRLAEWTAMGAAVLTILWLMFEVDGLALTGVTVRTFILSAVIGGYGFLVLAAGFVLRHRRTRMLGLAIVALVIVKIGVYDMWQLEVIWRFWIGVGIGSMLLVASLAYQRFVKIILGEEPTQVPR